ncbi:MAG: 50S ribosomal protein L34e [Candidatus Kariarchaeaceae archaeon]
MVRPKLRSGKSIRTKTPGGSFPIRSIQKKPNISKCASCGKTLRGTFRGTQVEVRRTTKTQRRPSRMHGGHFCHKCLKAKLIEEIRSQ